MLETRPYKAPQVQQAVVYVTEFSRKLSATGAVVRRTRWRYLDLGQYLIMQPPGGPKGRVLVPLVGATQGGRGAFVFLANFGYYLCMDTIKGCYCKVTILSLVS